MRLKPSLPGYLVLSQFLEIWNEEEIIHLFNTPIFIDTLQLHIACSLGISIYPDDAQSVDKLLIDADKQIYLEKRQKR